MGPYGNVMDPWDHTVDEQGSNCKLVKTYVVLPWIHVGPISSLLEPMWDCHGSMWGPCENVLDPLEPPGDEQGSSSIPAEVYVGLPWIHVGPISSLLESM
jgi:hypothetical protein